MSGDRYTVDVLAIPLIFRRMAIPTSERRDFSANILNLANLSRIWLQKFGLIEVFYIIQQTNCPECNIMTSFGKMGIAFFNQGE